MDKYKEWRREIRVKQTWPDRVLDIEMRKVADRRKRKEKVPKREVNHIVRIVRSAYTFAVTCFSLLSREGVLYANGLLKTWLMPAVRTRMPRSAVPA